MPLTIKNFYWIDIGILLLALVLTLSGIGSYGLYEPHEGHFAMVGQEMIWRNDWVTPHLNGSPYLNKPPLLYWLIASSTSIFGSTEFAARLPVGLGGWFAIVIAWKWARELWGANSSRIAALMLSVTLGWFIFTHQILIDVLLGTLLLSSNYFLWRCVAKPSGFLLHRPRSWINWLGLYLSLACCILTKGLVGVIFPLVACLALMIVRQDWQIIKRIKLYQGLLLVLAIVLPWFIAMEQANPGFLHYFLVNEHFERLLDRRFPPDYEVSKISAVGYLGITACWCFPWILFLPSVVTSTWREWQRGFLDNASIFDRQTSDGIFLLAMAAISPVVLFLPTSSRLIYYSIPAIPAYVILCAGWWDKHNRQSSVTPTQSTVIEYSVSNNNNSPIGILSKSSLQVLKHTGEFSLRTKTVNMYGAIAIALGIGCYGAIAILPIILRLLPKLMQTTEITSLITMAAIALGTGWLISGLGILRRFTFAWIPLFTALTITYLGTVRGFYLYQDLRSSKNIVLKANICLNADTLWTFEGSREIGAAGAIGYYLNQAQANDYQANSYRTVMVLADGGKNRLPPQFPGSTPEYLITQTELQKYWDSDRPVVFLTDFLRQPNDSQDSLALNLPQGATKPYMVNGQRQLYLNEAANNLADKKCTQK